MSNVHYEIGEAKEEKLGQLKKHEPIDKKKTGVESTGKTSAAVVNKPSMALSFSPCRGYFDASQSAISIHTVRNLGHACLAIKVKCSDNLVYRIRPIAFLLLPDTQIEFAIKRSVAPKKRDKLVLIFVSVPSDSDPNKLIDVIQQHTSHAQELHVQLIAESVEIPI